MIIFRIRGVVKEKGAGVPLAGLFIKSYDKDLFFDDVLGSAFSDDQGRFEIITEIGDFREFLDTKPDIYFKVYLADRTTLLHTTADAVKWNQGKISDHEILIPWATIQPAPPRIELFGDDGVPREEFSPGESLTVSVAGLQPASTHEFELTVDGRPLFTSRLTTNRKGVLEPTVLWPQMGLYDVEGTDTYSPEEAAERWNGRSVSLEIRRGKTRYARTEFRLNSSFRAPIVIASGEDGRLRNGFEIGTQPLFLTVHNLPATGNARIFMVPRQHDWQIGDVIEPVAFANGEPAVRNVDIRGDGRQQTIEFAAADALVPGAFDFIIRPVRYGFEEDDLMVLGARDIVGSRRLTGVVIRLDFWLGKPVLGGCVNKIPISGSSVAGAPYFRYRDTFTVGEDVWAGMDPGIVDPGNLSKACSLYVIQSKDDPGWTNTSLNHVLGGNINTHKRIMQPGCMNANKDLIWPMANVPGDYDIVADFGNNTPNLVTFTQDDNYNTPLDMIDGYFVPGFKIVEDPGTMQNFANAGNWNYTEVDMPGLGLPGTVNVQDSTNQYHSSGSPNIVTRQLRMKAHVFFPADMPGVVDPAQISVVQPNYPLIVIIHGNGQDYASYDFLLQHFARNGFIAASIDVRYFNGASDSHGQGAQGRAEALFHHLTVLNTKFGSTVQNNIGIMGHSRGGEAVIKAARFNQEQGLGHNINAVISLAPTDQYGTETLGGLWSTPYFVLYGSRDGDINGGIWVSGYTVPMTGFAQYDRANGSPKSMCFVYRATHNGFITSNVDAPWDGDVIANMEPVATQQAVTKAYMNAFFRRHLKNEAQWDGMFKGEWKPGSVSTTGVKLYMQYRDTNRKTVEDSQGMLDWQASSIGGTVTHNMTLPVDPDENKMSAAVVAGLDPKSPHDTQGLKIRWDNPTDVLVFSIPPAEKDVSGYSVLTFRITQKVDSAHNTANQPQDLRVALKDGANNERAVRVASFYEIPFPDHRPNHSVSKSAMVTVRIPLKSYTIVCAGQPSVNLQDVTTLTFQFAMKPTGEIEIDELEFSN